MFLFLPPISVPLQKYSLQFVLIQMVARKKRHRTHNLYVTINLLKNVYFLQETFKQLTRQHIVSW